ncbi:MAG: protein kinase [Deltaproteobacteria bacterium]|nr:protein kinase [Deltaproteobacteria bacterium]
MSSTDDAARLPDQTLAERPLARRATDAPTQTVDVSTDATVEVGSDGQVWNDGDTLPVEDLSDGDAAAMFRAATFANRYRRGEVLGIGGMGEVRGMADRATGRVVAMKTIRDDREAEGGLRRFAREARIQAQLEHPAVVPVYDVGVDDRGNLYFTMKRVRGESLSRVLTRLREGDPETVRRYSRRKLLTLLSQVAMTLEYAHRRGVVHRDLKPGNIMLGAFGEVYVLDWGLADLQNAPEHVPPSPIGYSQSRAAIPLPADVPLVDSSLRPNTVTGHVLGTPGYVAPEQIKDQRALDLRVDVYALGVILFELLSHERLHAGTTVAEVFTATLTTDGASPRARAPAKDIPPELDELCRAATRLDPAQRIASAGELARRIEAYLDGDRDLETRRRMAEASASAAAAALTAAHAPGADEAKARAVALREITTALGLDPDHARARALLVRILTEPAQTADAEAARAHERAAVVRFRQAARHAMLAMLTYIFYVPLVLWMGLRSPWMLAAVATTIVGVIGTTAWYHRHPPAGLRLPLAHVIVSTISLATGVTLFGPFVLLPSIVIATGVGYIAVFEHRVRGMFAMALTVVMVPIALQLAGVVPPWYEFDGGAIRIMPWMTEFPRTPTLVLLIGAHAIAIVASLWFVGRIRQQGLDAERRLRAQAWQLAQIVPEDARELITR